MYKNRTLVLQSIMLLVFLRHWRVSQGIQFSLIKFRCVPSKVCIVGIEFVWGLRLLVWKLLGLGDVSSVFTRWSPSWPPDQAISSQLVAYAAVSVKAILGQGTYISPQQMPSFIEILKSSAIYMLQLCAGQNPCGGLSVKSCNVSSGKKSERGKGTTENHELEVVCDKCPYVRVQTQSQKP